MRDKISTILMAAVFLLSFAVYLGTLNPVFNADDSPETTASCVSLGIQHPPGYPLHTMLGRLASLAPLGCPGFRLNLMAAFFAALAVALLFWNTRKVFSSLAPDLPPAGRILAALLPCTALLFAFSKTFWNQALAAKGGIYTLQASILGALFLFLLTWQEDADRRFRQPQSTRLRALKSKGFLLSCLGLGLGLGNHWETQVLFFPAFLAFAFFLLKKIIVEPKLGSGSGTWAPLGWGGLFFLSGLSVYALLPLRARLNPVMDWGHPADWAQFKWVLSRQEYTDIESGFVKALLAAFSGRGTLAEAMTQFGLVAGQGKRVAVNLAADLGYFTWPLSLAGLWLLYKKGRETVLAFCLALIVEFALVVTFYFHLKPEMIWILDVFLLPVYMLQAFLAAFGLLWLAMKAQVRWPAPAKPDFRAPREIRDLKLKSAALVSLAILVPMLLGLFHQNHARADQSRAFWAYDFGRDFLDDLKKDSLVFAEGDFFVMPVYYLQNVEGRRRDVIHLTSIFMSLPWGVKEVERFHPQAGLDLDPSKYPPSGPLFTASVRRLMEQNRGRRPMYASAFHEVLREFYPEGEAALSPSGLAQEYSAPATRAQDLRRIGLLKALRSRHLEARLDEIHPSTQFMLSNYATAYLLQANQLRAQGKAALENPNPFYLAAIAQAPRANRAEAWTHWGMALAQQGKPQEALKAFQSSLEIKPLFEAYSNMAGVYNGLKRYPEAVAAGKKAVELSPHSPEALNNLAIATYYLGDKAGAVAILEKAAALNPGNASVANNLRALKGN